LLFLRRVVPLIFYKHCQILIGTGGCYWVFLDNYFPYRWYHVVVINGIFVKNGAVLLVQCKDHTYIFFCFWHNLLPSGVGTPFNSIILKFDVSCSTVIFIWLYKMKYWFSWSIIWRFLISSNATMSIPCFFFAEKYVDLLFLFSWYNVFLKILFTDFTYKKVFNFSVPVTSSRYEKINIIII
jgi:hypothetical protein